MSTGTVASRERAGFASLPFVGRLSAAIPLASVYVWLCLVYFWEAWRHVTPWLFTDELELTQLSRAIAATGHAARRGEPHSFKSLYTFLMAPAWLIDNTHAAYDTAKYIAVIAMTAVLFPTYFIARRLVGPRLALGAAAAAAVVPALAYSSLLVEETVAYPYSTFCLCLILNALVTRSRWWIGAAAAASLVAPLVRGELAVLPAIFVLASLLMLWSSPPALRWRSRWSWGDWLGFVVLVAGAVFLISGFLSKRSFQWYAVTTYYKDRILDMGLWAAGAFAIGIGVLPVVLGLAMLWRAPGEEPSRELRAFRCTTVAAIVAYGLYTGVKAAYLSTVFATRTEERNIIYLAPLLFVATALFLERRRVNVFALAGSVAFAAYLVVSSPYRMEVHLYSDAVGLAILQQANRILHWTPATAQWALLVVLAVGTAVILLPRYRPRLGGVAAVALGAFVLAWCAAGEIGAAAASNSISRSAQATLRRPLDWVDLITRGRPTMYLGQGIADQNPQWLLEFWNRSIVYWKSLDATLQGPGPAGSPNIDENGVLTGGDGKPYPVSFVVEEPCVEVAGTKRGVHDYRAGGSFREWTLVRAAQPTRLRAACSGLYADNWSNGVLTAYTRYERAGHGGRVSVTVSRKEWNGPQARSNVRIYVGTLKIIGHEPHIGKTTASTTWVVHSGKQRTFTLPTPGPRFRVEVYVDQPFVPKELSPQTTSDQRSLGAVVHYRFVPSR